MWQEQDRQIFAYFANGAQLWADPIRAHRLMLQHTAGKLNDLIAKANKGAKTEHQMPAEPGTVEYVQALEAKGILAEAATAAFGLMPFDPATGQGTLESEALDVLIQFLAWLDQKKTTGGTTTSPEHSAPGVSPRGPTTAPGTQPLLVPGHVG